MRRLIPVAFLLSSLVAVAVAVACSSDDAGTPSPEAGAGGAAADSAPPTPGAGGGSGTGGSGGEKPDAGGGAAGLDGRRDAGTGGETARDGGRESGAPDSGDSSSTPKAGSILVVSRATEVATVFVNAVSAGFVDGPGNTLPKGCRRQLVDNCFTLFCDYADGGGQTAPTGGPVSAGDIKIGGTATAFTLAYDRATMKYGSTPPVPTDQLLFAGGSTITFDAAGQDVPAFADSLVAPTPITVTSPALPLAIDTARDLVFDWTGSSAGMVAFNIRTVSSSSPAPSSSFVSCQFRASALTGTIPSTLLKQLDKTDATTSAVLTTDLSTAKEVSVGDYSVHLAVGSLVTQADGKAAYTGQVTLH